MLESVLIVLLKRQLVVCGEGWGGRGWAVVLLERKVLIGKTNITLERKWKHEEDKKLPPNKLGHNFSGGHG